MQHTRGAHAADGYACRVDAPVEDALGACERSGAPSASVRRVGMESSRVAISGSRGVGLSYLHAPRARRLHENPRGEMSGARSAGGSTSRSRRCAVWEDEVARSALL